MRFVILFLHIWLFVNIELNGLMTVFSSRFSDLTGTDYSEGAIELARSLAVRNGFSNIKFVVCKIFLLTKIMEILVSFFA